MKISKVYAPLVIAIALVFCVAIVATNVLVDPLWYFSGDRLTGRNLVFNEREAKADLYYKKRFNYDCILFGSSSATTVDVSKIPGYNCFNFAFSGGTFEEFSAYARYVKAVGRPPKLIIVSVDLLNLRDYALAPADVPQFVQRQSAPDFFLVPYLSTEVLEHSIDEIITPEGDRTRYYSPPNFIATLDTHHLPYAPSSVIHAKDTYGNFGRPRLWFIAELRRLFPQARIIGYGPLFSSWRTAQFVSDDQLDNSARTRYALAQKFDAFYDFSVPSPATERTADTYDGYHYTFRANLPIIIALARGAPDAIRPTAMRESDYIDLYRKRARDFINRYKIVLTR